MEGMKAFSFSGFAKDQHPFILLTKFQVPLSGGTTQQHFCGRPHKREAARMGGQGLSARPGQPELAGSPGSCEGSAGGQGAA